MIRSSILPGVFLLLVGCSTSELPSTGNQSASKHQVVSGVAQLGRIVGATVTASSLDGKNLAETTTENDGTFSIDIGGHTGPFLIQVVGGNYIDEATGNSVSNSKLEAIAFDASSNVSVTLFSSMVSARVAVARQKGTTGTEQIRLAANAATKEVASIFGTTPEVVNALPENPGSSFDLSSKGGVLATRLATLSQFFADEKGAGRIPANAPPSQLIQFLIDDYAGDSNVDGFAGPTALGSSALILASRFSNGMASAEINIRQNQRTSAFANLNASTFFSSSPALSFFQQFIPFPPILGTTVVACTGLAGTCFCDHSAHPGARCYPGCTTSVIPAPPTVGPCPFQQSLDPHGPAALFCNGDTCGNLLCESALGEKASNCPMDCGGTPTGPLCSMLRHNLAQAQFSCDGACIAQGKGPCTGTQVGVPQPCVEDASGTPSAVQMKTWNCP